MVDSTQTDFDSARSQARIRAALDGVITIDDEGAVVEWNPAAERIFGYAAHEAVGRSMAELIVPEHMRQAHVTGLKRYMETGHGPALDQRLEMPAITADGRRITIELTITAFEASGRQWFTGWARDITEIKRTEEELAQSERRFQAIVEHSSDVITILDAEGQWLYTSQSGTRLTGYPKGHDPDGGIFALLHDDDVPLAQQALGEVIAGTRTPADPVELRIVGASGEVNIFETVGINMLDEPAVRGIVLHSRDVSERKAAERGLKVRTKQLAGLLANIQLGVLVEDDVRRVTLVNHAFTELFGLPVAPDAMVGSDCAVIAENAKRVFADPERFLGEVEHCIAGRVPVLGTELALTDGRVLERDYVPVLDDNEELRSHIWLYRDVTDRKQGEIARERMLEAERLARRSIEASQARLEEQNRSLRELDRLKTELVATVSHELRTPLTSIVSFGELLDDPETGPLTESQETFVSTIRRNADRLIRLVDDLLLLARLESETLRLDAGSHVVDDIVRLAAKSHDPVAADKGVALALELGAPAVCNVDATRIEQVVDNLVSNAVKFTESGGSVTVRSAQRNGVYHLEVCDTGIGVPEDEVDKLFSRFFRASNARAAMINGTGLGLAVCQAIVRLHGGTISVSSRAGSGTTVTVELPIEAGRHDG